MTEAKTEAATNATLQAVIVRACVECGGKRQMDTPCADCGNAKPPVVHDLGVQSAAFADPFKQLWWDAVGSRLAERRARKANEYVEKD